jgi:hypothetical protein
MIILDHFEQGSAEWMAARVGIPTASQFDKIITPKTMQLSASSAKYANQLIAEQLLGVPIEDFGSAFIQRGNFLEKRAVSYYELQRECDTQAVGFVLRDDRRSGASPDRLVGENGLLEIKCPSAPNHIEYLLDKDGIGYKTQVQGQLWIAEREWSDTLSFNPDMPPALVRQYRDEKYIKALAAAVDQFLAFLDETKVKLQKQYGLFPNFQQPLLRVS